MTPQAPVDDDCLLKISLARHLLQIAQHCLDSTDPLSVFAATNLLDDALEVFLLGASAHLQAPAITQNDKFHELVKGVENRLGQALRNKQKLLNLHALRGNTKHKALETTHRQAEKLALAVEDTFEHETKAIFGLTFWSFGVKDLLRSPEIKKLLDLAQQQFENGNYTESGTNCRKALFLEFERQFSIERRRSVFEQPPSLAPNYARTPEYAVSLRDPIDFIVIDEATLDRRLLTIGASPATLMNVRRLTPPVYKCRDGEWAVRQSGHAPSRGDAQYVLGATCELLLSAERYRLRLKKGSQAGFEVTRKPTIDNSPLYSKASMTSPLVMDGSGISYTAEYSVRGLDGKIYYKVGFLTNTGTEEDPDLECIDGYVLEDDFEAETPIG